MNHEIVSRLTFSVPAVTPLNFVLNPRVKKHLIKDTLKDERKRFYNFKKNQLIFPVTYKITDYNGEEIQGSFYEQELRKTKQDIFRIEQIIKQQENKSLVKWLDYHDSFNSWVDNKDINKL